MVVRVPPNQSLICRRSRSELAISSGVPRSSSSSSAVTRRFIYADDAFSVCFTHCELLDQVAAQVVAPAWLVRDRDRASRRYFDFRLDDVFLPVSLRGGNVTRQLEVGQGGECYIVGAADAGLEHASAPDGHAEALRHIVHGDGVGKTADAPDLDVDDAASTKFERRFGVARAADGLVQTKRRLDGSSAAARGSRRSSLHRGCSIMRSLKRSKAS